MRKLLTGVLAASLIASVSQPAAAESVAASAFARADISPGLVSENGLQYAVFGGGTETVTPKGPVPVTWARYAGTSIDDLKPLPNADQSEFGRPHGDDLYWMGSIWRDPADSAWYGVVHAEYDYLADDWAAPHLRRILLAKSTDQGLHWQNLGDVLTPDTAYAPPTPDAHDLGTGDMRLLVDAAGGYFYLFYLSGDISTNGGYQVHPHVSAARCPISAKLARGCWQKWYGGSFSQPGVGGHDGVIMPFTGGTDFDYADLATFSYNQYLGRFVAVGHNWMSTATDLSAQNWTLPQPSEDMSACNYTWSFDPATRDPFVMGRDWRHYSTGFRCGSGGATPNYHPVSFAGKPTGAGWYASNGYSTGQYPWTAEFRTATDPAMRPMSWNAAGRDWVGSEPYCAVFSATQQHPGSAGCDSARTWTAPYAATVTLGAGGPVTVPDGCLGNSSGVRLQVLKNGAPFWPSTGPVTVPNGRSFPFPAGVSTPVQAGDRLQFVTSVAGGTNYCDGATWDPVVTAASGQTWRASLGYSLSDDQWHYEYSTDHDASFHAMAWDAGARNWVGSEPYCAVFSATQQHPGSAGCDSARTWTAPYAATVTLGAHGPITVADSCLGNTGGVSVQVIRNGTRIWPESAPLTIPHGGSSAFPGGIKVTVSPGDQLRFVVSMSGTTNYCDSVEWDPAVIS